MADALLVRHAELSGRRPYQWLNLDVELGAAVDGGGVAAGIVSADADGGGRTTPRDGAGGLVTGGGRASLFPDDVGDAVTLEIGTMVTANDSGFSTMRERSRS